MINLLIILLISCGLIVCSNYIRSNEFADRRRLARRLNFGTGGSDESSTKEWFERISRGTIRFGWYMLSREHLSKKDASTFRELIISAGLKPEPLIYFCVGGKFLLVGIYCALGLVIGFSLHLDIKYRAAVAGAMALIGSKLPEFVIKLLAKKYRNAIVSNVSDMLDMMVVCAEAGLTLETLIERVGREVAPSSPEVSKGLGKLSADLKISSDRRTALMNFGRAPNIEAFQRLAVTLVQSAKFGTPLGETLRTLSAEMRNEMIATAEEKAGKLPALLTVPMILFILPSVFCLLIGPAALRLMHHT